jgi:O-antigen/teichoic acid export membrane protein
METFRAVGAFVLPLLVVTVTHRRHFSLLLIGILFGYLLPIVTRRSLSPTHWRRLWPLLGGTPEWQLLRSLWQYGWPVALWLFCQQSLVISDRYFIGRYLGFSPAGVYASMYDVIVRSFSLVMTPVALAVHSVVMNHWNLGHHDRALQTLGTGAKYQLALFVPVVSALLFLAPGLTHLVLGRDDHDAAAIVLPLAVGGFLWQISLLAHKPLEVLCQTKRMLVAMLTALVVNASGNYLFIPKFGLKAPAYLSMTSSLVYLVMIWLLTPVDQLKTAICSGERTQLGVVPANHLTTA